MLRVSFWGGRGAPWNLFTPIGILTLLIIHSDTEQVNYILVAALLVAISYNYYALRSISVMVKNHKKRPTYISQW